MLGQGVGDKPLAEKTRNAASETNHKSQRLCVDDESRLAVRGQRPYVAPHLTNYGLCVFYYCHIVLSIDGIGFPALIGNTSSPLPSNPVTAVDPLQLVALWREVKKVENGKDPLQTLMKAIGHQSYEMLKVVD